MRKTLLTPMFAVSGALLLLFFALPMIGMVAGETPTSLWQALGEGEVRSALWVSELRKAPMTAR